MTHTDQNLELILFGWVDALRRRDPDRIADRLSEDIVWQGLRRDREADLHNLVAGGQHREQLTGIEVAALDDRHVLLGIQLPGVTEFFGETLDGAIIAVFTIDNAVITRIDDRRTRVPHQPEPLGITLAGVAARPGRHRRGLANDLIRHRTTATSTIAWMSLADLTRRRASRHIGRHTPCARATGGKTRTTIPAAIPDRAARPAGRALRD